MVTLGEKTKDGWCVSVSSDVTCKFLEFSRKKKISLWVDVGVISGGLALDTDCFYFSSEAKQRDIERLIEQFIG
jgi:hypothetical protein